jgi:NIPSNAP
MRRMKRRTWLQAACMSVFLPARIAERVKRAFLQAPIESPNTGAKCQGDTMTESAKVYELRIYHAAPGQLDKLVARFRDYTDKLFAKHGMMSVAYWRALDEPVKSSTFFYILQHPSREAAAANWKAFQDDPEWKSVKAKSEENGKLVEKIDSTYLTLTDFSREIICSVARRPTSPS